MDLFWWQLGVINVNIFTATITLTKEVKHVYQFFNTSMRPVAAIAIDLIIGKFTFIPITISESESTFSWGYSYKFVDILEENDSVIST